MVYVEYNRMETEINIIFYGLIEWIPLNLVNIK